MDTDREQPEHTWTDKAECVELVIDGRIRGYVERHTRLAFWEISPASLRLHDNSFCRIGPPFPTVQAAKAALEAYVDAKDAICDGSRGIPGIHDGCTPALCKPKS